MNDQMDQEVVQQEQADAVSVAPANTQEAEVAEATTEVSAEG